MNISSGPVKITEIDRMTLADGLCPGSFYYC
jgi:hypothetical protein